MKIIYLILLVSLIFSGCASSGDGGGGNSSYFGQHQSALLRQRGQPHSRHPDGQGGEVWIYQTERKRMELNKSQDLADEYGQTNATFNQPEVYTSTSKQSYHINSQGYIYKYE